MSLKELYSILGVIAYLFCAIWCIGYSIGNHAWVTLVASLVLIGLAFPLAYQFLNNLIGTKKGKK